jgi:uncharacterized Ntn-hydrolase superfamily protein
VRLVVTLVQISNSVSEGYGSVAGVGAFAAQADAKNTGENTDNKAIILDLNDGQKPIQILTDAANTWTGSSDQFGIVTLEDSPAAYTGVACESEAYDVQGTVTDHKCSVQSNRLSSLSLMFNTRNEFNTRLKILIERHEMDERRASRGVVKNQSSRL